MGLTVTPVAPFSSRTEEGEDPDPLSHPGVSRKPYLTLPDSNPFAPANRPSPRPIRSETPTGRTSSSRPLLLIPEDVKRPRLHQTGSPGDPEGTPENLIYRRTPRCTHLFPLRSPVRSSSFYGRTSRTGKCVSGVRHPTLSRTRGTVPPRRWVGGPFREFGGGGGREVGK